MIQKKAFVVIVVLLVSLLSSCSVYDEYYENNDVNENWRYGTEGITLDFLTTDFVFYDGDYMRLQLVLRNEGAYDKPVGKIVLSGVDSTIVHLTTDELDLPDEFYGKKAYNDEGSTYFVDVPEDAPLSLSLGDTYEADLQTSLCYTYQTVATPTVCLLYDPDDDFICQQNTLNLGSQAAPVAVRTVEQSYMQDRVRFTVTLDHVGDGTVLNAYDLDAYDACPFALTRDHLNYVAVDMNINELSEPRCVPANKYVKLNDRGEGVIVCTFTLDEPRSYPTLMEVTLDYSYLSTTDKSITIAERDASIEREVPDYWGTSSSVGSNSGSGGGSGAGSGTGSFAGSGGSGECWCSDANMKKWGGCICLYIAGQEYWCLRGKTTIPIQGTIGDTISYEVQGSNTVSLCGDGPSPGTSCPFSGTTTVSGSKTNVLNIYGTTVDGRPISEACNLVLK
jgi:uncharacterized membrane protein YgcG